MSWNEAKKDRAGQVGRRREHCIKISREEGRAENTALLLMEKRGQGGRRKHHAIGE